MSRSGTEATVRAPNSPSPSRPEVNDHVVAEILADFLRSTNVPGVAAGLFTAEGVVAQAAQGTCSLEDPDARMTPQTVGMVYSLSKVMTATAAAMLADSGSVDLDEPVATYLPDIPGRGRFSTTTLRHLLSHTSGLVRGPVPFTSTVTAVNPLERYVLDACLGADRFAEPGEVFGYSEIGVVIAGYVLQRVTRVPFAQLMQDLLFEPAGMDHTTVDPMVAITYRLSQQHVVAARGGLAVRHRLDAHPSTQPSSGAFSCVEDLARLGVVHLGGPAGDHGRPLLTAGAVSDIHTPVTDVGLDILRAFGLAVTVGPRYGSAMSVGHEGYYGGAWSKLLLLPDQGIGVAWMDNRGADPTLEEPRQQSFDRLLSTLGAGPRSWERDAEPGDADPHSAAGSYGRPTGQPITLSASAGRLRATLGPTTIEYEHLTGRVFVARPDGDAVPGRFPWAPDKDSTRSALCVVGAATAPTHILVNGLPYQRL